jgi:ABC-2 type transport system ATP-binding protein
VSAPAISLESLSKWYGDVLAVNEVTCEFGAGVTGLLGPNGAGKSTLIKVVTGMLGPAIGTVRVLGHDPQRVPAILRRVGLVPEQDPVYAGASAFDVVAYLTRLHGFSRADAAARARSTLERVGLGHAMDRGVGGFSKGMRQRAKLAQALAHDPDVLILDEPMNGLDPVGRRDFSEIIRTFGAEGRCVLVSSHVLHEVEAMTHRVVLMDHGRIVADGTIEQIRLDLSDQPHVIAIASRAPRALAARVVSLEGVQRVEVGAAGIAVLTTRPDDLFDAVSRLAIDEKIPVEAFHPTDESLEAVFRYVTT